MATIAPTIQNEAAAGKVIIANIETIAPTRMASFQLSADTDKKLGFGAIAIVELINEAALQR